MGIFAWLCWVIWLQRYVVYTDTGANLDFEVSANEIIGEVATPPAASNKVSVFYNEGDDAIDVGNEMKQLNGYYIDADMLQKDMTGTLVRVAFIRNEFFSKSAMENKVLQSIFCSVSLPSSPTRMSCTGH